MSSEGRSERKKKVYSFFSTKVTVVLDIQTKTKCSLRMSKANPIINSDIVKAYSGKFRSTRSLVQ